MSWRSLIAGVFASLFCCFTDHQIIYPIAAEIAADLNFPKSDCGVLASSYSLFTGLSAFFLAPFTDTLGRVWFIRWAGLTFFFSLLLCGMAPNYDVLLISRCLNGVAAGPLISCLFALPGDEVPVEHLDKAYGVAGSTFGAATVIGISVSTWATATMGWRSAFFILVAIYFPAWLFLATRSYKVWEPQKIVIREQVSSITTLFKRRDLVPLILAPFMGNWAVYSSQAYFGVFFQVNMGVSINILIVIMFFAGIATIAGSLMMPYLTLVAKRVSIVSFGFLGGCLMYPFYYTLGSVSSLKWFTIIFFIAIWWVLGVGYAAITAHISIESSEDERGRMLSFQSVFTSLGISLGAFWPSFFIEEDAYGKLQHLDLISGAAIIPALGMWYLLWLAEDMKLRIKEEADRKIAEEKERHRLEEEAERQRIIMEKRRKIEEEERRGYRRL